MWTSALGEGQDVVDLFGGSYCPPYPAGVTPRDSRNVAGSFSESYESGDYRNVSWDLMWTGTGAPPNGPQPLACAMT